MNQLIPNSITHVSFDIFDTLVHRRLAAPVDIFFAVRNKLCESDLALYNNQLLLEFPDLRIQSEKQGRKTRIDLHGGEGEITLEEIYDELKRLTNAEDEVIVKLMETELELERLLIYVSFPGQKLYNTAKREGKTVIFISDMYLPVAFIKSIMLDLGYSDCSDKNLFVSGNVRKSKWSGGLFSYVGQSLNIQPEVWLHVGDNLVSDIANAKKLGIKTHHANWSNVKNKAQKQTDLKDNLISSVLSALGKKHFSPSEVVKEPFKNQGYYVFGPLIFGFYLWLLKELKDYDPDKLLFFARDSQLMYKIHRLLDEQGLVKLRASYKYTYLSRRSLYEVGFTDIDLKRFGNMIGGKTAGKVEDVFTMLGINITEYSQQMKTLGVTAETQITEKNRRKIEILMSRLHSPLLLASSASRKKFQEYFTKMIPFASKIALIDIGWAGNIQTFYLRTLGEKWASNTFRGFFLGTLCSAKNSRSPYRILNGWLVNEGFPKAKQDLLIRGGIELLEFALTADHGSTLGYTFAKNGEIIPILEEKTKEEITYETNALQLQSGVLAFVKDHMFLLKIFPIASLQSNLWQKAFLKLVEKPTYAQLELFSAITHSDNVGVNSKRIPLVTKISFLDCIYKGANYYEGEKRSYWKSAYSKINSLNYRINRILKKRTFF